MNKKKKRKKIARGKVFAWCAEWFEKRKLKEKRISESRGGQKQLSGAKRLAEGA